jgi:hypothetical protein
MPAMSLSELIANPTTPIAEIARHLDGLDDAARVAEATSLPRSAQRMLYEKAAQSPPIDLTHFVDGAGPRVEVVHEGRNTLPLPAPLRRFQKRFCRPDGDRSRLFGYNEGPTRKVVGPGYFVAIETRGRPHWEARGAIVIDYWQVPDAPVVAEWPEVIGNDRRLQRFVYHQTRDFMRRVSEHVSIGAAFKKERPLDHYFVLVRSGVHPASQR